MYDLWNWPKNEFQASLRSSALPLLKQFIKCTIISFYLISQKNIPTYVPDCFSMQTQFIGKKD